MTILARLRHWQEQGAISAGQHAQLTSLVREEPFSVFLELNVLLYAGVLAFVAGLGWTVATWSAQLGGLLARGIHLKDRFVITVGALAAILTFVSNKPYLGWQRHTWDPMLLGIGLIGAAALLRRWLARGPNGVRHGFTAARLTKKDSGWIHAGSPALGFVSPQSLVPATDSISPGLTPGGGASGGGGASRDF